MKKLVAMAIVAMTVSGCAAMRAASARDKFIQNAVMGHTFQQPCGQLWAAARTMLFARDYQVKSADAAAGLTLETEWKTQANGNMVTMTRYLFQGSAPTPETCQVSATAATKNQNGNTNMSRDWRMEWDLLKQVDIGTAQRIEADAHAAGEAARNTQS